MYFCSGLPMQFLPGVDKAPSAAPDTVRQGPRHRRRAGADRPRHCRSERVRRPRSHAARAFRIRLAAVLGRSRLAQNWNFESVSLQERVRRTSQARSSARRAPSRSGWERPARGGNRSRHPELAAAGISTDGSTKSWFGSARAQGKRGGSPSISPTKSPTFPTSTSPSQRKVLLKKGFGHGIRACLLPTCRGVEIRNARQLIAQVFRRSRRALALARLCHGASAAFFPRPVIIAIVDSCNAAAFSRIIR